MGRMWCRMFEFIIDHMVYFQAASEERKEREIGSGGLIRRISNGNHAHDK